MCVQACVCQGFPEAHALCSRLELSLLATEERCVTVPSLCPQPLKVVDPDHPLAMLVRKAQADSPAPTPPAADGATVQPTQAEYTADCEYLAGPLRLYPLQSFPRGGGQAVQVWQRCPEALRSPGPLRAAVRSMRPRSLVSLQRQLCILGRTRRKGKGRKQGLGDSAALQGPPQKLGPVVSFRSRGPGWCPRLATPQQRPGSGLSVRHSAALDKSKLC